ncbi:MAG: histone deacetylase family protein [Chloroflexi bacterium]|nr:histone deacetylase family protein [Chloroflexota bacterium]
MKVFYSETHRAHNPTIEIFEGGKNVPYLETPERVDRILASLQDLAWIDLTEPDASSSIGIQAIHDKSYITFLETAWREWMETNPAETDMTKITPLLPATFALRSQSSLPKTILGKAGYYMMDLSACLVEGTYPAAMSAANCAVSAAQATFKSLKNSFALCRPPGHHAGLDFAGGYCFINNAAAAAHWFSERGRTAVLDIDYHAGNGTQDIFYDREDVLTISIHADPAYEYPYFAGYPEEIGSGQGQNYHRNFPLPKGVDDSLYLFALDNALIRIREHRPQYLVVSLGLDIYRGDPLGKFNITRSGIGKIGKRIADLAVPTCVIMEGGYAISDLGDNLITFLENFK